MEERFRQISHLTTDITYSCVTDDDGTFSIDWMSGNTEKITGYTVDEIIAQSCWRFLVLEEDMPLFDVNVIGLSPGQSMSGDLRIRHKSGKIIYVTSFAECKTDSKIPGRHHLYGALVDITVRKQTEREREALISKLQQALSEVKTLSGLLPICAVCKKIRDDKGYWNQLEIYIRKHTGAQFSHGICPECAQKMYPELNEDK